MILDSMIVYLNMRKLSHQIIKCIIPIFIFGITNVRAQVKLACCGIDQVIPVFKADTNFDDALGKSYFQTRFLSPIRDSEAAFEIRVTGVSELPTTVIQVKCSHNVIIVKRYKVVIATREV